MDKETYLKRCENVEVINKDVLSDFYDALNYENYEVIFAIMNDIFDRYGRYSIMQKVFPEAYMNLYPYFIQLDPKFINDLLKSPMDNFIGNLNCFPINDHNGSYHLLDVIRFINGEEKIELLNIEELGSYFIASLIGKKKKDIKQYFINISNRYLTLNLKRFNSSTVGLYIELIYYIEMMKLLDPEYHNEVLLNIYKDIFPYIQSTLKVIQDLMMMTEYLPNTSYISIRFLASMGEGGYEYIIKALRRNLHEDSELRVIFDVKEDLQP